MLVEIKKAKIRCVGEGDEGYPVKVGQTPKTCRFDKTEETSDITCDMNKLEATSESNQYVLIHHEFAGLAEIEPPDGESPDYQVSNQISGFLESRVIKMLAVKKTVEKKTITRNFDIQYASRNVVASNPSTGKIVVEYRNPVIVTSDGRQHNLYNGDLNNNPSLNGFCMAVAAENGVEAMDSLHVERGNGWTSMGIGVGGNSNTVILSAAKMGVPASRTVIVHSITCAASSVSQ